MRTRLRDPSLNFRRFKIGVFAKSGDLDPHPGCVRVVRDTAELLRKRGHDVVEVSC